MGSTTIKLTSLGVNKTTKNVGNVFIHWHPIMHLHTGATWSPRYVHLITSFCQLKQIQAMNSIYHLAIIILTYNDLQPYQEHKPHQTNNR